jgi:undecaprenyl diphosphate synthase
MAPRTRITQSANRGESLRKVSKKIQVPEHIAIVMDGNGRWAKERGLPRTAGHEAGEKVLFDLVEAAIGFGVKEISAYAFSTENWKRTPEEVKFLMGYSRDVLRKRRDRLNEMGVKIQWIGRPQRLWKSVINELEEAEELTKKNKVLTLNMCVNYGGRSELVDATAALARDVKRGKIKPDAITEKTIEKYLYSPNMRDVDLFLRSSGEQRTSNFLPWQSVYAEFVFMDVLWPDMTPKQLWRAIEIYSERDRRFGKA